MASVQRIRAKDYRYSGESLSLAITLFLLLALYFTAIWFLHEDIKNSVKTQAITLGGLALYLITILFQQRSAFGTLVRVGEKQFSEIHKISVQASERLGAPQVPIYIKRSSDQNIYTMGIWGRRIIVLHSSMADQMGPENLQFFIGREIGHMQAGHTWLRAMLKPVGSDAPLFGKFVNSVVFGDWWSRAESTADRAGLIACNSLTASVTAMLKLGVGTSLFQKMDIREFLNQIQDVRSVSGRVAEIVTTQPYLTNRVKKLVRFTLSEQFQKIVPDDHLESDILSALPQTYIGSGKFKIPLYTLQTPEGGSFALSGIKLKIGRSPDNDIYLEGERISRYHAEIEREGANFVLRDNKSLNGVLLNGERISGSAPLKPGDRIKIGERELIFSSAQKPAENMSGAN